MKKEKGITMVALIITIILMLILATVTVTVSINGGLINSTKEAKENARGLDIEKEVELWKMSVKEDIENGNNQEGTLSEILEELKENGLLTEEEINTIKETQKITIGNKTIDFSIISNTIQEPGNLGDETALAIKIGDYVDYDPTLRVEESNKEKLTYISPVGMASSHGNGYLEQKFEASKDIKWRVFDIDKTNGTITLISEGIIGAERNGTLQNDFVLNDAIGYLYSEQEIESACAIYGYGYGADTSKSTTYNVGGPLDEAEPVTIKGTGARSVDVKDIMGSEPTYLPDSVGSIYYPTINGESSGKSKETSDSKFNCSSVSNYYINNNKNNIIFKNADGQNIIYWLKSRTMRVQRKRYRRCLH